MITLAALLTIILAASMIPPAHAEARDASADAGSNWLTSIPREYHGRWALITGEDEYDAAYCELDGWATSFLTITPSSAITHTNTMTIQRAKALPEGNGHRVDLVWVAENRVTTGTELWTLRSNGKVLETAGAPQMGWEVASFHRCPDAPGDGSLSELPS